MASHGTDQLIVQRLLSARNLRDGQKAIIGSGIVVFIQFALFLLIGLGLWAFYQGRIFPATDQIFPTFIIDRMPPGLVGLIIAAVDCGDDEHALRRDQFTRRRNDARHLPAADAARRRRAGDAQDGQALRARSGVSF